MPTPRPNPLATGSLDRSSRRRHDAEWLARARHHPSAVVHLTVAGKVPTVGDRSATLGVDDAARLVEGEDALVLLGTVEDVPHFAADVSRSGEQQVERVLADAGHDDVALVGLRDAVSVLRSDDANLLAFAAGIATWHTNHTHCGRCGAPTVVRAAGHERHCEACGHTTFPRTDPAIIVLVRDRGNERVVLGRQKVWHPRMYSTLAGFLEPGESLEDTVAREVGEEVGLRIDDVRYSSSQPWPFPQSLMLGFHAVAATDEITVALDELEDARWFTRDVVEASIAMGRHADPMLPGPLTIARRLIDEWITS